MSDTDPYMAQDAPKTEEAVYTTPAVEATKEEAPAPVVPQDDPLQATLEAAEGVPAGSIKEVLAWVGDDATKAQKALDAENDGDKRSSLISKLEALIK
jgi:hypothetical protein